MTRATRAIDWLRRRLDLTATQLLLLAAILALATAVRVAWVSYAARTPQEFHDPLFYMFYAGQISAGNGYRLLNGDPTAYYPIGYPATLGALFFVVRHTIIPDNYPNAAGGFQVFLGVLTVALAFYVGRKLFGAMVGLLSALWIALFPNLVFHTAPALTETLFNAIVMAMLAVLFSVEWRKGEIDSRRLVAAGLLLGAAALVRPIALLLLPVLFLVWLVSGARWQRATTQLGLVVVTAAAVIAPWSIRNFVVMKSPIFISANLGDDLCMGHHPGATGHFELPDFCCVGYDQLKRPEFEIRRNNDNIRRAISYAVHNPRHELKLIPLKARWTYDNDHDGLAAVESYGDDPFLNSHLRDALARTANIYFFFTISVGGLGLIALTFARGDPRRMLLVVSTLTLAAVPLVFFGDARFHVPAMPLASIAAAWMTATAIEAALRLFAQTSSVQVAEGEGAVTQQNALQDSQRDKQRDQRASALADEG